MQVQGEDIPSIEENPIKCTKLFDDTLTEKGKADRAMAEEVEKSGLPG